MAETSPSASEKKTFEAGCHCGYISLSVTLQKGLKEQPPLQCNCSICTKAGYLLTYPLYEDVTWHNGSKEKCSVYQFNTKKKDQLFCPKCGTSIGIDFRDVINPKRYGISARTFYDFDVNEAETKMADGRKKVFPAGDLSVKRHEK